MTKENSKGMKDLSASSVSHVSRKPLQCIHITTPYAGHVVEVTFRNHSMPMKCSLLENGFLPVFSIEGKVMLYSNPYYCCCSRGHNIPNIKFVSEAFWLVCYQQQTYEGIPLLPWIQGFYSYKLHHLFLLPQ